MRTWPVPTRDTLDSYYEDASYSRLRTDGSRDAWERRAQEILAVVPGSPASVLDFGAGEGHLVRALRDAGVEAQGVEPSRLARLRAANNQGVNLFASINDVRPRRFAAATLLHSLEHVDDPIDTLRQLRAVLHSGAAVYIEVPHAGSADMWLPHSRETILDVPAHLHHFTPRSLSRVVHAAGLAIRTTQLFNARPVEAALALRRPRGAKPRGASDAHACYGRAAASTATDPSRIGRLLARGREWLPGSKFVLVAQHSQPLLGSEHNCVPLSVLMVTWNTRDLAVRSIDSVLATTTVPGLEVIVVDNASSDGTIDALRNRFPEIRVVANTSNVGAAAAFNHAMMLARGDCMLLLQADAYVTDNVISRMVDYMAANPEVGQLGCELRFPSDRHQHTAIRHMSIWHSLVWRFWLYRLMPVGWRACILLGGYWPAQQEVEPDWLAAIQMVRRDAYVATRGFDERFFAGGEESEWARRVRGAGYRIRYVPSLGVIWHIGSASWLQVWTRTEQLRRWHRLGVASYAVQHGPVRACVYRVVEGTGVAFRCIVYRIAHAVRPNEYHRQQATHHRMLLGFYLRPQERDKTGRHGDSHLR